MTESKTFQDKEGKLALVWCGECLKENYALNVLAGICAWCGFDVNAVERIGKLGASEHWQ